jgi:hypothetical protein
MKRHVFDPISAFFGVVFLVAAAAVGIAEDRFFDIDARWLWPALLIVAGGFLVFSGTSRRSGE